MTLYGPWTRLLAPRPAGFWIRASPSRSTWSCARVVQMLASAAWRACCWGRRMATSGRAGVDGASVHAGLRGGLHDRAARRDRPDDRQVSAGRRPRRRHRRRAADRAAPSFLRYLAAWPVTGLTLGFGYSDGGAAARQARAARPHRRQPRRASVAPRPVVRRAPVPRPRAALRRRSCRRRSPDRRRPSSHRPRRRRGCVTGRPRAHCRATQRRRSARARARAERAADGATARGWLRAGDDRWAERRASAPPRGRGAGRSTAWHRTPPRRCRRRRCSSTPASTSRSTRCSSLTGRRRRATPARRAGTDPDRGRLPASRQRQSCRCPLAARRGQRTAAPRRLARCRSRSVRARGRHRG